MASSVGLLAKLVESILQDNRELLLELNVGNVLSAAKKENPVIAELDISPELRLNAERLSEGTAIQVGLVSIIFTIRDYLEVFVGAPEANTRVGDSISRFTGKHEPSLFAGIRSAFPELFEIDTARHEMNMDSFPELEKARRIFTCLMKKAAQGSQGSARSSVLSFLKTHPFVKSVSDDIANIEYANGLTLDKALDMFSESIDTLKINPISVKETLREFGSIPDEIGLTDSLSSGALSDTTTFGCAPIDRLLRDGLRNDATLLLEGPAGVEKEVLAFMFVAEGLRKGGCAIFVSSICPVAYIKPGLEQSGIDLKSIESEGRLLFVDWHSRFTERVTSIDVSGNVYKISNDLTNLAVGIDMALKHAITKDRQVRLVIDMASPTIIAEGFDRVHEFLSSVRAKMKNHSCTGLVLLNPGMHPKDETSMLEEIFDGTMVIERSEQHNRMQSNFRITYLSGAAFSPAGLTLSTTHRGMEISGGEDVPAEVIPFDHGDEKAAMGLLGIESLSPEGLPVGRSFLVWIPSSMMPADYVKPVVMEAQKDGHAILLALSSLDSDIIGEWMSEKGLSRKGLIDRGLLQIVDWYGQKSAKVLGMEQDEGIIRTSRDLTHLGVGIDFALRRIGDQFSTIAVMELHSQAIRLFDLRSVYSFAQSIDAKLAQRGFTTFVLMERNTHEPIVNAAMEELFGGIIDIRSSGSILEIALLGIRGCHFQSEYRPLSKHRDRLTIDVSRRIPDAEISGAIAEHGLASRLKELEKELDMAVGEKAALEKRLVDMSLKETGHERKHAELRLALQEIESRMAASQAEIQENAGTDVGTQHKAELARLFKIMDDMLEKLPEDVINRFAMSEDFKLYEKILSLYLEDEK